MITTVYSQAAARIKPLIVQELKRACGHLRPQRIVLKPNWVLHETDPAFPIRALVTDPRVIEAAVEACWELFPGASSILVADCPLQYANWQQLCQQSGLQPIIERLQQKFGAKIAFRDVRKDVFRQQDGSFLAPVNGEHGDPKGYRLVSLGMRSHLEPISNQAHRFAVNDYSAAVTASKHKAGEHEYLVGQSFLDADLFINLPKWKSHQKSAITGALKNLVGINGDKSYLPHFRRGAPKWGGDEYRNENRWLYWLQTTLRERTQKRQRGLYGLLKPGWEVLKRLRGIETRLDNAQAKPKRFYIAGGAWSGNDTIWRMIYDLNLIIQCANAAGSLHAEPQRHYFCIVDGLISGEGNGPLQPLPRETDWLIFGDDPFAIDAVLSFCMGFEPSQIPVIARRQLYGGPNWGDFELPELEVMVDGARQRVEGLPINFHFAPPPGWRDCVER